MQVIGIETIRRLEDEAARKSASKDKIPYIPFDAEEVNELGFYIPDLGDYRPRGWELIDEWPCDSSAIVFKNGPALTLNQIKKRMVENLEHEYGYAILKRDQLQVVVGVFKIKERKTSKTN